METAHAEPIRSYQAGTEAALVARARTGDGNAISELVRTHAPRLRWVAWRVVRNWADAEDVVQDALWRECRHLSEYEERAAFSTWLTRIAVNEGVGLLRKRRTDPVDLAENATQMQEIQVPRSHSRSPQQILVSKELERAMRHCMERMRPDYRAALNFRILDELSHDEIAQRLDLSVAAVKTRIHRARVVLRRMLQRRGVGTCAWPEPQ